MSTRVVVTGIGVVAPSGLSSDEHWQTMLDNRPCIGPITAFDASPYPTRVAGEVRDVDLRAGIATRVAVQTDRWTWMGLLATEQALGDADLDLSTVDPYDVSVVLASSSGGNAFGQRELQRLWRDPSRTVGAYQSIAWFYAATVGQISIANEAKGPSNVLVAESAGGLDSLAHAARIVRRGTPVVIAGGIEAPLSPYALACQLRSGRLAAAADRVDAYQPFDRSAQGFVPGEGGSVFVVEDLEHARARGAHIYGEITGAAATHDARHTGTRPVDGSVHYGHALQQALDRAGTPAAEVGAFVPDAVGLPGDDRDEATAVRAVFGDHDVPVTTHKALVGRLYQGGSALDAAEALLALDRATLPASAAPADPAPGCELNFVEHTRPADLDTVLVGARGFDGYNSALVLARYRDADLIGAV